MTVGWFALAQDTGTTSPPRQTGDDDIVRPLLSPGRTKAPPLVPMADAPVFDESTQKMIPARPPEILLIPEGVVKLDRIGRLTRNADNRPEFLFEPDGLVQPDPAMIVLPNRMLAAMEQYQKENPESWFRVSYRITQYYPRNYMMIEAATPTTKPVLTTQPTSMPALTP